MRIICIIAIICGACHTNHTNVFIERDYQKKKSLFADSLVAHFPSKLGVTGYTAMPILESIPPEKNSFHYWALFCAKTYKKDYDELCAKMKSLSEENYKISDKNLLLINYMDSVACPGSNYPITEPLHIKTLAEQNLTLGNKLPVPWFSNDYHGVTILDYYDPSFKLHVIDAQPGIYLPKEKLYDSSKCMPEKWRHGYSQGVALCDKTRQAIFWIIIW